MVYIVMAAAIGLVVGFAIGSIVVKRSYLQAKVGKLRMDDSTGDPYLFLELSVPIEIVLTRESCVLDVDLEPITRE